VIRRCCLVMVLLVTTFAVAVPRAAAAGTVTVTAWNCPDGTAATADAATLKAACTVEAVGTTFALTAGGFTRGRATAAGKPASWTAVTGEIALKLDLQDGLQSVVFCQRDGGAAESFTVLDGQIYGDLGTTAALACDWFLLKAAVAPTSTATTAPLPSPTSTPAIPPTATPRAPNPTATPRGATPTTNVQATPTPRPAATEEGPRVVYPPAMFRGDPGRTGLQPGPGPVGDPVLLWRYPVAERTVSSPVKAGDTIYTGGDNGLLAIDARTGSLRWKFETERTVESSPAVAEGLVYFGGKDGVLYCLNAESGVEVWRAVTGAMILSSPLVADGQVYITSYDGHLYGFDAATGTEQWRYLIEGSEFVSSPAIADGIVFVGSGDIDGGKLYGVEAATGVEVLRRQVAGSIASTPAIANGVVYFGSDDGTAYALNLADLQFNHRNGVKKMTRSSVGVFDNAFFIGGRFGTLFAFDVDTGAAIWEFEAGDWIDSSPSFADGILYLGTKNNRLLAMDPGSGAVIWEVQIGSPVFTTPLVQDSVVYVAARDGYLYAFGGSESAVVQSSVGRPADVPLELVLDGEHYLFDRMVTEEAGEFTSIGGVGQFNYFDKDVDDGFGAIYTNRPSHDENVDTDQSEFARYLPALIGIGGATCAAEIPRGAAVVSDGQFSFGFAGAEPDWTVDELTEIATSAQLGAVFAVSDVPPFADLYVVDGDALHRFVALNEDGVPDLLAGLTPYDGEVYSFAEDVSDSLNEAELVRLGCAGQFPVFVEPADSGGPPERIIAGVAGRLLSLEIVTRQEP
jgi:eukaryotic-like serine/threonine-protein kinase